MLLNGTKSESFKNWKIETWSRCQNLLMWQVDTCLKVFCDETVDALKFHPGMQDENVDGTVTLIAKIIEFWKMVNINNLMLYHLPQICVLMI